jgi:hypothetical protein
VAIIKQNREAELAGRMVNRHLGSGAAFQSFEMSSTPHLDEDMLNAFTEGRLGEAEARPLVLHLVDCFGCRRATAELIQLSDQLDDLPIVRTETTREPGRVRRFLEDLVSRALSSGDENAVFAYHAPTEETEPKKDTKDTEDSKDENSTSSQ